MSDLSDFLKARGIEIDLNTLDEKTQITDDKEIRAIGAVWNEHEAAIKKVLQARVNLLAFTILNSSRIDKEGEILQMAILQVTSIISDFEKYSAELARQDESKKSEDNNEDSPPPEVPEGAESAL